MASVVPPAKAGKGWRFDLKDTRDASDCVAASALRNVFNVEFVAGHAGAVVGLDGCSWRPSIAERDHLVRVERDEIYRIADPRVEDAG